MGVAGLLKLLKKHMTIANVSQFKGCVAAVDMSCWMHSVLHQRRLLGSPLYYLVQLMLAKINVLLEAGVTPVIVFDGASPPAKSAEAAKRSRYKEEMLRLASLADARNDHVEAAKFRSRASSRTPELKQAIIMTLEKRNNPYVVAPYEADAQIVWLVNNGYANLVVSVDSDFILHGCRKVLFQLKPNGNGFFYDQGEVMTKTLGYSYNMNRFRWCMILCGTDYFPGGVQGFGMKKALLLYQETEGITDAKEFVDYVAQRRDIPTTGMFRNNFFLAENTLLYQVIFDVQNSCARHLNQLPPGVISSDIPFAGSLMTSSQTAINLNALKPEAAPLKPMRNFLKCIRCGMTFTTRDECRRHWKEKHARVTHSKSFALSKQALAVYQAKLKKLRDLTRKYPCSMCDQMFTRPYAARLHEATVHKKLKPFKCNVCSKGFGRADHLQQHMACHNMNKKKYKCTHCDREFNWASRRFEHLLVVNNVRVHQCDQCDMSFTTNADLTKHQKTHLPVRPRFQCGLCESNYSTNADLTRHQKQKHSGPQPKFVCEICKAAGNKKEYVDKKSLNRHYRQSHPDNEV